MLPLVCIDVDGTLIGSSGDVHAEIWVAAARVRARGMRLAICSGRPAFGATRVHAARLDPDGWHIFQNGASVVHLPSGVSRSQCLAPALVDALVARAHATGRVLELYGDTEYAVESAGDRARRHAGLLGVPFAPRDFASLAGPVVRAQWVIARNELDAVLADPIPGLTMLASVSPVMPDTVFVNITPLGIDKAAAVRAVAAEYGVPLERVMMVGDGQNDIGAMRAVGVPVAMANAEPEVRAAARHVVGHVDEQGLVDALELAESV
jgi:Cof subfamily protein (haloacid dehalogenase superfamily)